VSDYVPCDVVSGSLLIFVLMVEQIDIHPNHKRMYVCTFVVLYVQRLSFGNKEVGMIAWA
jgi:hypothetical protein